MGEVIRISVFQPQQGGQVPCDVACSLAFISKPSDPRSAPATSRGNEPLTELASQPRGLQGPPLFLRHPRHDPADYVAESGEKYPRPRRSDHRARGLPHVRDVRPVTQATVALVRGCCAKGKA